MSKEQNSSGKSYPADEPSQLGNNYAVELDAGEELIHYRKYWWQLLVHVRMPCVERD